MGMYLFGFNDEQVSPFDKQVPVLLNDVQDGKLTRDGPECSEATGLIMEEKTGRAG